MLFRSFMDADGGRTETALYTVPLEGGLPETLPMPTAGAGDFSPDGKRIVYSPLFRDFRTWKRYQGGWAQDLFVFDLASHALEPVAHSVRTERDPMWIGDAIYFVSDRDGTLNLYRFDLATKQVEPLTARHDLGRALGQQRTTAARSSTSWTASWRCYDAASRTERRHRHPRPRRRPEPAALARTPWAGRSRTSSSRPRASARCSWPAATSSRCRSRRAPRAT